MRTDEGELLRATIVRTEGIFLEGDGTWLVAVILLGMENVVISWSPKHPIGTDKDKNVHDAFEDIENIAETITAGGGTLRIRIEWRITQYYRCGLKSQLRRLRRHNNVRKWLLLHCSWMLRKSSTN